MDNEIDKIKTNLIKMAITTKNKMPKFDYTATKEEIKFNNFASRFLKGIKFSIINNNTNEIIVYNEDYYRTIYNLTPNIVDNSKYNTDNTFCGCKNMEVGVQFLNIRCKI